MVVKEMVKISEPVKMLCTGDIHLGRHPAGLPDIFDGKEYSPGSIWQQVVRRAVADNVDLVVVAGDVVDRKNRYFEAFGDFESGLKTLTREGIPLYLVSGNHDFDVVPPLVSGLSDYNITQLGQDGSWEWASLSKDGVPVLQLCGWSYPSQHVEYNPIQRLNLNCRDDLPVVGMLHSDLGRPDSKYAPVTRADLEKTGFSGWVIGHVHKPELKSETRPFKLSPGSPQPLDQSEPGTHGPWILTIDNQGAMEGKQLSLSNLRYTRLSLNVEGLDTIEKIPPKFYSRTSKFIKEVKHPGLQLLIVTLELRGRAPVYDGLKGKTNKLARDLRRESAEINIAVTSIINNVKPPVDLVELAQGNNPVAMLADLILKLEKGDKDEIPDDLIKKSRESLNEAYYSNAYQVLRSAGEVSPPGKDTSLEQLKEQAWLIMNSLISQNKT